MGILRQTMVGVPDVSSQVLRQGAEILTGGGRVGVYLAGDLAGVVISVQVVRGRWPLGAGVGRILSMIRVLSLSLVRRFDLL